MVVLHGIVLAAKYTIEEDVLKQALIDHLEEFLLELDMGAANKQKLSSK